MKFLGQSISVEKVRADNLKSLRDAVRRKDTDCIEDIIESRWLVVEDIRSDNNAILKLAVECGCSYTVRYLISILGLTAEDARSTGYYEKIVNEFGIVFRS